MIQNIPLPLGKPKYTLRCVLCGAEYVQDPFRLRCDEDHGPSLLRTVYSSKNLNVRKDLPGLFQFLDWLPIEQSLEGVGKPITYESKGFAAHLGLDNLLISFNGYWSERDANLLTCSFKELEAITVLARIPKENKKTLVLASAGNTGRAFASACSSEQLPLYLVIPEKNLSALWSQKNFHPSVCLVVVSGSGDYSDAIALGRLISNVDGFFPEGGAANVARRDGMGLTVLDAAATLGRIPDYYFQAVGSGSGGIAAWEANLRLLEDGRFGLQRMKLHLSQNFPFTPMVDAWRARRREISSMSEIEAKERISRVSARVLTTREPAYSLAGGLYEALVETNGEMYSVTNEELERARILFEQLEGIDISRAAGTAAASLIQAVKEGKVGKRDCILLNITGGGFKRMRQEYALRYLEPKMTFTPEEIKPSIVAEQMALSRRRHAYSSDRNVTHDVQWEEMTL
jgi:cysteate synthase